MRKRIGLITICPEEEYQTRLMDGIFAQCEKYDYDVVVVAPLAKVTNFFTEYLEGELNIYGLINFDLFDGVIVTPIPMTQGRVENVVKDLKDLLDRECKCPVVCADLALDGYPLVETDDAKAFEIITDHLVRDHHCRKIAMLTGMKDYPISDERVKAVREAMKKQGLTLLDKDIYYGDFWYSGGEKTAEMLAMKRESLPDAVICASDTMAIGLTRKLRELGIRVPEYVIVTGFDANNEAVFNDPIITSYAVDAARTGALCVNFLREQMDAEKEVLPAEHAGPANFFPGESCGCTPNITSVKQRFSESLYFMNRDRSQDSVWRGTDIGMLMESYTSEILTATTSPLQCLEKIYESIYLLKPYGYFYLALNENWLDPEMDRTRGYDEHMHLVIISDMAKKLHGYKNHVFFGPGRTKSFETKTMLPALSEEFEKPQVFYFVPVHFNSISLGYAVLQNDLSLQNKIGLVYRNYIRNINNSLEMSRTKYRISQISEHDMLTGLYNRRGMEREISEELGRKPEDASYLCIMMDMDSLKYINDTFGHSEGDRGLSLIARAAAETAAEDEFAVRAGGDEFYIMGIGVYDETEAERRVKDFKRRLEELNREEPGESRITASAGYALMKVKEVSSYTEVMEKADVNMYLDKRMKKLKR